VLKKVRRSTWERRRGGEETEKKKNRKKNESEPQNCGEMWQDQELRNKQQKKIIRKKLTVSSIKLLPAKIKSRFLKHSGK
jgi:hypothetical protein